MNIIGHKNIFLTVSAVLVGAAILAIIVFGFKEGIDFRGGTLWQFKIAGNQPGLPELENVFHNTLGVSEISVNYDSTNKNFLVRMAAVGEAEHQKYLQALQEKYPGFEESSFQSIGPSIGQQLKTNALIAIGLVIVGISLYIAFAFRKVSRPVSSWKYGWITLLTLFHDVAIPAGMLAVLGRYVAVEIDSNFMVALLVVMGFSVHDTIVVFDRIRENLSLDRGKHDFKTIINESINQTLARSINTSLTLILVLLAILFSGPAALHYFILTLLVGVTTGIYSSIFVASPLLLVWYNFDQRKNRSRV